MASKKGRNREKCKAYAAKGQREKNKRRKLHRHINKVLAKIIRRERQIMAHKRDNRGRLFPPIKADSCAEAALKRC